MASRDVKLSDCPVLKRKVWDDEDVLVAADWAMERGLVDNAEQWTAQFWGPELTRAALAANVDPFKVAYPDDFTTTYIEAALWATYDGSTPTGGVSLEDNYDAGDIALETFVQIVVDCADFQEANAKLLDKAYSIDPYVGVYSVEYAGHDFWLTRNGHGAGFWDRGLGGVGDVLTKAAKAYGSFDLYVGDDGKIHGG